MLSAVYSNSPDLKALQFITELARSSCWPRVSRWQFADFAVILPAAPRSLIGHEFLAFATCTDDDSCVDVTVRHTSRTRRPEKQESLIPVLVFFSRGFVGRGQTSSYLSIHLGGALRAHAAVAASTKLLPRRRAGTAMRHR